MRTAEPCRKARQFQALPAQPAFVPGANEGSLTVASETAGATGLGERYATALYDLADEQKLLDAVADDLRALRQMIGVFAQLERGMISARLRSGRLLKAERGGYAGFGAPPYGTRAADGELVPEPSEVRAIERACALRTAGTSLRAIAEILTAEGFTPRRTNRWHPETLRRLLERAT